MLTSSEEAGNQQNYPTCSVGIEKLLNQNRKANQTKCPRFTHPVLFFYNSILFILFSLSSILPFSLLRCISTPLPIFPAIFFNSIWNRWGRKLSSKTKSACLRKKKRYGGTRGSVKIFFSTGTTHHFACCVYVRALLSLLFFALHRVSFVAFLGRVVESMKWNNLHRIFAYFD